MIERYHITLFGCTDMMALSVDLVAKINVKLGYLSSQLQIKMNLLLLVEIEFNLQDVNIDAYDQLLVIYSDKCS